MKVIVVTPAYPAASDDIHLSFIHKQCVSIKKLGCDLVVCRLRNLLDIRDGGVSKKRHANRLGCAMIDGMEVMDVGIIKMPGYSLFPIDRRVISFCMRKKIKNDPAFEGTHVVHGHGLITARAVWDLAAAFGSASVLTLHGIEDPAKLENSRLKIKAVRDDVRRIDMVVLVGRPLLEYYSRISGSCNNFRVVPNGFDRDMVPVPGRNGYSGGGENGLVVASVSGLHRIKGIEYNLKAVKKLVGKGYEYISYWIVGDGPDRERLQALTFNLGLEKHVRFLGEKDNREVFEILGSSQVFSLPSYQEAFGIVYLEAMASGIPVIACHGQGGEDIIDDNHDGFLVPEHDPDAIAEKLEVLIRDKAKRVEMGENAREKAFGKFTWEHSARKMMNIYQEISGEETGRNRR